MAIDGTKIKANANKHKAMSYARMQQEEARLAAEIDALLRRSEATDAEEDARYGAECSGDELPTELAHREGRLRKIREAKAALEAEARAAHEAAGGEGEPEAPGPKAQKNFTDPESRILKGSDGAFVQAYNAQAAIDHDSQVIVAAEVVQDANDKQQLVPMVMLAVENLEETPEAFSADAGYWAEEAVEWLEQCEVGLYVAPEKIRHRQWREQARLGEPVPPDWGSALVQGEDAAPPAHRAGSGRVRQAQSERRAGVRANQGGKRISAVPLAGVEASAGGVAAPLYGAQSAQAEEQRVESAAAER